MAGTFDDFFYGDDAAPEPSVEEALLAALPDLTLPAATIPDAEPPSYEDIKYAKEAQAKAVTPDELAVIAAHKAERRDREAQEEALRERRQAQMRMISEASPKDLHNWTLVALHMAEQEQDPKEKVALYEDAFNFLSTLKRAVSRRS